MKIRQVPEEYLSLLEIYTGNAYSDRDAKRNTATAYVLVLRINEELPLIDLGGEVMEYDKNLHEKSCKESEHISGVSCPACSDLLPCPCCGSTNVMKKVSPMARMLDKWISCLGCEVSTKGYQTFKEAAAAWNTRTQTTGRK
jgi:hypothetical protein